MILKPAALTQFVRSIGDEVTRLDRLHPGEVRQTLWLKAGLADLPEH